jgi:hypothetical protein
MCPGHARLSRRGSARRSYPRHARDARDAGASPAGDQAHRDSQGIRWAPIPESYARAVSRQRKIPAVSVSRFRTMSSESSSVESSSEGSAKIGSLKGCVDCKGTCTFPAVEFLGALVWDRGQANASSKCSATPTGCGCVFPARSPDFVGDIEVTDCDCCFGCQYLYHDQLGWWDDGINYMSCSYQGIGGHCHGSCATDFPTGGAPQKIDNLYPAHVGVCH